MYYFYLIILEVTKNTMGNNIVHGTSILYVYLRAVKGEGDVTLSFCIRVLFLSKYPRGYNKYDW